MNEVTIHRGPSSHLIYMNVGVDGQHLTEAVVSYDALDRSAVLTFLSTGGRPPRLNTNRLNSLLTIGRRTHRPPLSAISSPHRHLTTKLELPTRPPAERRLGGSRRAPSSSRGLSTKAADSLLHTALPSLTIRRPTLPRRPRRAPPPPLSIPSNHHVSLPRPLHLTTTLSSPFQRRQAQE